MVIDEIKSGFSIAASSVNDKLKDSLSFLSDVKDAGWNKVNVLVNDVLGLAPLIEVAGFNLKELHVEAGIPPGILLMFFKDKEVDAQTINNLLEENKDKEILILIVRGLQKADELQKSINLAHYKFSGLNMKLGLPPQVSLKFIKKEEE